VRRIEHAVHVVGVASLLTVLVLGSVGLGTSSLGHSSTGSPATGGGGPVATESPTGWTPTELATAAPVSAPYREPGLNVPLATYDGPADFASAADPSGSTPILLSLAFSNASSLRTELGELTDPESPDYHHYLTAAQFDREFGASPTVYRSLVDYLQSEGVTAIATHPDRLTVSFEATPEQLAQLFHTEIGAFTTVGGATYFGPRSAPTVPGPLAPYLTGVMGLSNYSALLDTISMPRVTAPAIAVGSPAPTPGAAAASTAPGQSTNPFPSATVTSNGLTNTYDAPVLDDSSTNGLAGKSTSCDAAICGQFAPAPDLQVAYNETGLFAKYGYPSQATVAALLWSDPVCTADNGACESDGFYNAYCGGLTSGSYAWDFFLPDVTSFWNYTIPAGEPMPTAISLPIASSSVYAHPAGSRGYSASCDDGGAEEENTLDVDMLGSLAPGANVVQVFGAGSSSTTLATEFSDVLSPSASEFSSTGGFDTAANLEKLDNVSVVTNSWTSTGSLGSAWTSDLEEAAARGITVLGASGDSGTTLEPPAEVAGNTFGTVAVGGTTLVVSPTTLARTAAHLASLAAPYYGVGGGEIGWYEPVGTVDGFSGTYGSTGGVATSTSYYRATWFNASADSVLAADAVRSGDYRAAPDLAAVANDTIIDLDVGPDSLNITCWVSSPCRAVSSIAVGTTAGSAPTVAGSYLVGTSVAAQVAGGVVATIDHSLHRVHQGWLGYLDPVAYAMGQKASAGELHLAAFHDITTYTGAGGLVSAYEDKAGYDLADGWGAIDAGNYTQNTMTFNATFTESSLPTGSRWSVTVTPTLGDANCTVSGSSCSNAATRSSTGATIVFPETYGTFDYSVGAPSGSSLSPSSGTVSVRGAPSTVRLSAGTSSTYTVTFTESGLPAGSEWWINLTGAPPLSSTGTTLSTALSNGTYPYTAAAAGTAYTAPGGSVTVDGNAVGVPVTFTSTSATTYPVTFTESGLPTGTEWWVNLTGRPALDSTGGTISTTLDDGSYSYHAASANKAYRAIGGSFAVSGGAVTVTVPFAAVVYSVGFTESGLPSGTSWSVSLGGTTHSSTTSSVTFSESNGTFSFTVGSVPGYTASPASGSVVVAGAAVARPVAFSATTAPTRSTVTFSEKGLPKGTEWEALIVGAGGIVENTSVGSSLRIVVAPGSYEFEVFSFNAFYDAEPAIGSLTISGSSSSVAIVFADLIPGGPAAGGATAEPPSPFAFGTIAARAGRLEPS